jgi:hypothetical protein
MFGAMSRQWSTILNGNQVDMAAFKTEIDAGAVLMRRAIRATEAAK